MTTKTYYLFGEVSHEYLGLHEAQPSPTEPDEFDASGALIRPQVYIHPFYSTDIAPPAPIVGEIAVFHSDVKSWMMMPDFRGQVWFDQITGASTIIQTVGQPAENLAPTLPASVLLDNARAAQVNTVTGTYYAAIYAPIAYMGSTFQADSGSQSLMAQVISASGGSVPAGFAWFDATNNPVAMTFAQLQGLAQAILLRGQPLFVKLQTLKAEIRNANTIGAVTSIVW